MAQISSTGPEIPFVTYQLEALSSCLLRLPSSVRVLSWQAADKILNHCSLADLVSFLPTTQLYKRQGYTVVCLNVFDGVLFLITCFRKGGICCTFISMTNSVACLQRNQASPGCLPDFPLTRKFCRPSAESFPLSPGSCSADLLIIHLTHQTGI